MKKTIVFILTLVLLILIPYKTFANSLEWTSTEEINMSKEDNEIEFQLSVDSDKPYAGAEFGIQLSEGVKIKAITYGTEASSAGPTDARGLTWFTFFSGENKFSGEVIVNVTLEYIGGENTSIVVDNISLYNINGSAIDTKAVKPRKVIELHREGATNTVIPPIEPESNSDNINNTLNLEEENSENKNIIENSVKDNTNNKNDNSEVKGEIETDNNSKLDNYIQSNASLKIKVLLTLLIISLGGNVALGYIIIKNKIISRGKVKNEKE